MNIFKTKGFDTIISKGNNITGEMTIVGTCVIEGKFSGPSIKSDMNSNSVLVVGGEIEVEEIMCNDLTITGTVNAGTVYVTGTLAIKCGCVLKAKAIYYRTLVAEPGAVIIGEMRHFEHSSDPLEI